jgi:hypothetical protein
MARISRPTSCTHAHRFPDGAAHKLSGNHSPDVPLPRGSTSIAKGRYATGRRHCRYTRQPARDRPGTTSQIDKVDRAVGLDRMSGLPVLMGRV